MLRVLCAAMVGVICLTQSSLGQTQSRQRPPTYSIAERQFGELGVSERLTLQTLLAAEGTWQSVPNRDFSLRLFNAISEFQSGRGYSPNGILTEQQVAALADVVRPSFSRWGFEQVWHPTRPQSIWVPKRLLGATARTQYGIEFKSASNSTILSFDYVRSDLKTLFENFTKPQPTIQSIDYKILRKDFFAIAFTGLNGRRGYMRFHQDGDGVLGFHLLWTAGDQFARGEQLATLISSSLYSRMSFGVSLPIPDLTVTNEPRTQVSRPPVPPPAEEPRVEKASSGSGFFVNDGGFILTNAHVVEGCSRLEVTAEGQQGTAARVIASDKANDLALVRANVKPPKVLSFKREAAKLGEPVVAFGFPLTTYLTRNGNFTLGNVTALAGMGDDTRYLQISTPVQPGNSGGPLLDGNGNVTGIVTAKLNAVRTAMATGDIPQNVNFAIKANQAIAFMEANRVEFSTERGGAMSPVDLAEVARLGSAFISCR